MKPTSLEVAVILSASVGALILARLHILQLKRRQTRFLTTFNQLQHRYQLALDRKEFLHNTLIGYDEAQGKVLLVYKKEKEVKSRLFSLYQVKTCFICISSFEADFDDKNYDQIPLEEDIQEVVLVLQLNSESNEDVAVPFYNYAVNDQAELPDLAIKAMEWRRLLIYNIHRTIRSN